MTRQCTAERAGRRQKLSSSKRHDTPHSRKSKTKTQKEIRRFICLCDAEVRDEQSRRVAAIRIISTSLTNGRSCSRAQITRSRDWSKLERRGGERTFFSIPLFSPMHRLAPSLLKLSSTLLSSSLFALANSTLRVFGVEAATDSETAASARRETRRDVTSEDQTRRDGIMAPMRRDAMPCL